MTDTANVGETKNSTYIAEFSDGPLQGTTDARVLIDGEYDRRFATIALVEGIEATFQYRAVDVRDVEGQLHVRYVFDSADSDEVRWDRDEESIEYP